MARICGKINKEGIMILYNLKQYLNDEFPTEKIYAGSKKGDDMPDRLVQLIDTGGTLSAWFEYVTETIQIIVRDIDSPRAYKLAKDIYDKINNRYGLILPANTVGTDIYTEIQTAQISANQTPGYIGDDEGGRSEYSTNYRIIY
jgi:hypothetical protein